MDFLIIGVVILLALLVIKTIYKINIKELKAIGENNQKLDNLVKKYPSNIEICKDILKILNNESVKIEEEKNSKHCIYIVLSNKIIIGNIRDSFTRIQTIAHECLHSVQDKSILMFNFVYSNIYLLLFYTISILGVFKIIPYKMMCIIIFILFSFIYYFVRSYLEDDAMIKARFLAKEYMKKAEVSSKLEIERIVSEYDKLNNIGIKTVNFGLLFNVLIRILILTIIFFIR